MNPDGSGRVRYGKLQVGQAAQVQPGPAGTTHQPQQDLVTGRAAGDHAGAWSNTRTSAIGPVRPQPVQSDGGADLDPQDLMEKPAGAVPSLHISGIVLPPPPTSQSPQNRCSCQGSP